MRYLHLFKHFFCLILIFAPFSVDANVSLNNGNFFISYLDLVYSGGIDLKMERVYNSKSHYKGIFGWGWGNEYEVYLTVSADGSIVIHEYGSGADNRFTALNFKKDDFQKSINQMVEVAKKSGLFSGESVLKKYRDRLLSDAEFRNFEWDKMIERGKIKPQVLPVGTQLRSNLFNYQFINKIKTGYVRVFDTGKMEEFDELGRLVKVSDKNNNFVKMSYLKEGRIGKMVDNFNRKIFLSYNTNGLLEKVEGEGGQFATYQYNKNLELVKSIDSDKNQYEYHYDTAGRHNLVAVHYRDKTKMQLEYYGLDQNENIKSIRNRDGTLTEYVYGDMKKDPNYLDVSVIVKDPKGDVVSKDRYEYFFKVKPDGERWTYRYVTTLDGERTVTEYGASFSLPVLIQRGQEVTRFQYDLKGHLTRKETPTHVTELTYDPQVSKVSRVVDYEKSDPQQKDWTQFSYDAQGNLLKASNSKNRSIQCLYDRTGRIKSILDLNQKKRLDFEYNEQSKPIKITDPALGSVQVTYANSGEVKSVESSAGSKMSMEIFSIFKSLMEMIRPSGVSLSF